MVPLSLGSCAGHLSKSTGKQTIGADLLVPGSEPKRLDSALPTRLRHRFHQT